LPTPTGDDILVGLAPGDDAAVYRLAEDRAIVATVDVITPIVDDPTTFGRIAATNSISDLYAMGARPLLCLSVACFNEGLPTEAMGDILAGASEVALEAGAPILGGHTVKDQEVKFGLVAIGEVHPDRILANSRGKPGEVLILTKAIGSAALATAFKSGAFDEQDARYQALVANMLRSNGPASRIAVEAGSRCATDITGFGLSGHLLELAEASRCGIRLHHDQIPMLPGAREALEAGFTCGGAKANERHVGLRLSTNRDMTGADFGILSDPQTAGPLIFSVRPEIADTLLGQLHGSGYPDASVVGLITDEHCGEIRVT
jgi:selenide,water dikinase